MTPATWLLFLGLGVDPAAATLAAREQEEAARFPNELRVRAETEAWSRHIEWMKNNPPYPAGGDPRKWGWEIERAERFHEFWALVLCVRTTDQERVIPKRGEALAELRKVMGDKWGTGWHPPFIGGVVRRVVDVDGRKVVIEE
jgi:hypothetical protein